MLFPTIEFAVFFAVVFPVTWLLNAHNTWKKFFLVAASYFFYAAWRPEFTLLLLVSSVFNYGAAFAIDRFKYRAQRAAPCCGSRSPPISACSAISNITISSPLR